MFRNLGTFGIGAISSNFVIQLMNPIKERSDEVKSENLKQMIDSKQLQKSQLLQKYNQAQKSKMFVRDRINEELKGFSLYEHYFEKEFIDIIDNNQKMTLEEKQKLGKIYLFFQPNATVQGHNGVMHGATILDDLMGKLSFILFDQNPVATANLQINYKRPCKIGVESYAVAQIDRLENDKKLYLNFQVFDENHKLIQDGNSLFIKVNWNEQAMKQLMKKIQK